MEDLKQIQEFFSKPLEEMMSLDDQAKAYYLEKFKKGEIDSLPEDPKAAFLAQMTKDQMDHDEETLRRERGLEEADVDVSKDIPDIIAVDVPLFIRLLEFAREDAGDDMDLHEVAERAIEAVKMRGVLSMDDYETLVPSKEDLDEVRLVPKDQIETLAAKLAAQIFAKSADKKPAIEILKKAIEDSYRAIDPEVEIREEEGYSKYLKDDPEFPGGKTPGLTPDVLNKILMKIVQDIDETKKLGENLNEELCPKGKAYIKKRMAAGEKSSAYLSGRAVKVCKGQMEG